MKRYGNLWEKVIDIGNIRKAHECAKRDKSYYREVRMVESDPDYYLGEIRRMLANGSYEVSEYKVQTINDKGKERRLMKLRYYPDRIIQWAIMLQLEPIFFKTFCKHVCASIPGRGIKRAYNLIKSYLKDKEGTRYCAKLDVRKFYDNVRHDTLKSLLRRKIKDKDLLSLLDRIIDSYPGERGVPIGSYLSQYFANFYLCYMDHWMKETLGIRYVVRYMDDIIILDGDKAKLHMLVREIMGHLDSLGLELKGNWQVFPVWSRGIDFIGYRFFHTHTLLRKKTASRVRRLCEACGDKERLGYREWCALNSYAGWLMRCDSWRLFGAYVSPLVEKMCEYYWEVITARMDLPERVSRHNKYRRRLLIKRGLAA